jgi:lysyl-tRNA synthetase class 2
MYSESDKESVKALLSSLPYTYDVSHRSKQIKDSYSKLEGKEVSIAGRIMGLRKSGKLLFADVSDRDGKMQCYFDYATLGEETFGTAKKLNVGDIIGAKGIVFKTNSGEPSVKVGSYSLLAKSVRSLPEKWHGIKDSELRYRKRHLDLIMNQEVRELFAKRSKIVSEIRRFLDSRGFMEFETPVIQPLYGGADAKPFKVFVNTLDEEDYLRISDELYLKRLIIGGMEKVYEIYKAFRNEDIDSTHSPEFTMIEWYEAYADYNGLMNTTEEMLCSIAKELDGTEVKYRDHVIAFGKKFKRIQYVDSISEKLKIDLSKKSDEEVIGIAEKQGIKFEKGKRNVSHAYDKLFSLLVQPDLIQPTFVIDFPRSSSPLTRPKRGDDKLVERFELYIGAIEIANAYSELNNPIIQRENFDEQVARMKSGDEEAEPLDTDFVEAMEYGMPPTGGIGIGIDRLTMILTNADSIKETILFPMEKRLKEQNV